MKNIHQTKPFRRDLKRLTRAGQDLTELRSVIERLANGEILNLTYRDHWRKGNYHACRECHIRPDWLLIYESSETDLILVRTGSQAELFC